MADTTDPISTPRRGGDDGPDHGRRNLLLLVPAAVFGAVAATLAGAAYRFLRPMVAAAAPAGAGRNDRWATIAPVSELAGDEPVMRQIAFERVAGWESVREVKTVYVLPRQNNRVVSAVCPHEECEVVWRREEHDFFCPCHDSRFAADGARVSGPARAGLAALPSRVENGVLQVQYPTLALAAEEQSPLVRG
ncbi:MAG: ubiquinol-cytochrome c reductase iron-sulfur subunit [Pyrinomonadaceae bacterium]